MGREREVHPVRERRLYSVKCVRLCACVHSSVLETSTRGENVYVYALSASRIAYNIKMYGSYCESWSRCDPFLSSPTTPFFFNIHLAAPLWKKPRGARSFRHLSQFLLLGKRITSLFNFAFCGEQEVRRILHVFSPLYRQFCVLVVEAVRASRPFAVRSFRSSRFVYR